MPSPDQALPEALQQIENPEQRETLRRAFEAAFAVDHISRDVVWAEVEGVGLTLDGYWNDARTFESLLRTSVMVKKYREKERRNSK